MKKFILLMFALGFIPILGSTQRPLVIDHSYYFEEPDNYFTDRQPLVSAMMILKASIWNAEISRDPNLAKNRFNGDYIWSKVCDPETGEVRSAAEVAEVMKERGALTRYSLPEFSNYTKQVKLSSREEEIALMFKTQAFFSLNIGEDSGYQDRALLLRQLKDSLIQGKHFVLSFPMYQDFWGRSRELYQYIDNDLWGPPLQTSYGVVMGYDDNIKTQKGYGAFIMRFNDASQPLVYYDYQWLLRHPGNFSCYFLQEKLKRRIELGLHITISKTLDNLRSNYGVYPFTDTLVNKPGTDDMYDYSDFFGDYRLYKSIARVSEVNGKKLPQRKKRILLPINNGSGNYELFSDISSVASKDFEEIKVSVLDLAEGRYDYYIPGVKIGYLYDKPEPAQIESAYISILGTDEKIIGKVESLPDTMIYLEDFRSYIVDYFGKFPRPDLGVNSCKFTLRRKVITFSAGNKTTNSPPIFSEYEERGITARPGQNEEFQFKAVDPDGDNITYSLIEGDDSSGFQINSQTGLVSFSTNSLGNHFATILASDGNFTIMKDIQVLVLEAKNQKMRFSDYNLDDIYWALVNVPRKIDFSIIDYDAGLDLPSYELIEGPSSINSYYLDPYTGNFQFLTTKENWYYFTVRASSQGDTLYHEFIVKVGLGDPIVDPVITSDAMNVYFKTYPNPVLDELCLEVESDNFGDLDVAIFDINGKLLNNFRESCVVGPNHFYINTSKFKAGMYFVKVMLGEKNKTMKIVKK